MRNCVTFKWLWAVLAMVSVSVMLNACARPMTTGSTQSALPQAAAGVMVIPPTGQPEPMSVLLAKSLAGALNRRGYEAKVGQKTGNPTGGKFTISGRSETLGAIHAPTVAALYWTLTDNTGREVAYLTQGVRGKADDWAYGSPAMLYVVGDQAAADLAPFLGHSPLAEEQIVPVYEVPEELANSDDLVPLVSNQNIPVPAPPPPSLPPPPVSGGNTALTSLGIWVDDVTGAPGDGNSSLTRAIRRALEGASVPFAITASTASHFVQGVVDVSVIDAISEHVTILWAVSNAKGEEIGRITQRNEIVRGSLHQTWGDTARYAAIGGAEAVIAILERDYGNN